MLINILLMLTVLQDYISLAPQEALSSPVFGYSLLLVCCMLFCCWLIRKTKTDLVSVFCDEEGAVQITPQALRELVRKSCEGIPGIHSPSTKIFKKSKKIWLSVGLRVEPNCKVKETRQQLRETLETVMVENLNFSNFGGVNVIIKGFQDLK
jgi:hypothetical protein